MSVCMVLIAVLIAWAAAGGGTDAMYETRRSKGPTP